MIFVTFLFAMKECFLRSVHEHQKDPSTLMVESDYYRTIDTKTRFIASKVYSMYAHKNVTALRNLI